MLVLFAVVFLILVGIGGYYYNRMGPGDNVRNPNVKQKRNNWVP